MKIRKKPDLWKGISLILLATFFLFLVYPMFGLLKQAVITPEGSFTLKEFGKFFEKSYYYGTIFNSLSHIININVITENFTGTSVC